MNDASFDHVFELSDTVGIFEHAEHSVPRLEHGYCTDDVARLLIVIVREPEPSRALRELGRTALRFLAEAQGVDGKIRNRRDVAGRWHGKRGVEDCWGRAVWAFGSAARRAPEDWMRQSARAYFDHSVRQRSPWPRAMAFASLGAAEVLAKDPRHPYARDLLADTVTAIGPVSTNPDWPWPEPRLTYANAVFPDVLIAAGNHLARHDILENGLTLLRWLLDRETNDGHLSTTPVGGSGPGDLPPGFDQQPIEVATMADACARAATVTGDAIWLEGIELAANWFTGDNDAGAVMWNPETGGGFDGLHETGPNLNQGAESTLALCSTQQLATKLSG